AFAARAAQLARGGQGEVELAVGGGGAAFAAAGGGGGAGVEDLLEGHGGLLWGVGRRGASGKAYCAHRPPRRAALASGKLDRQSGSVVLPGGGRGAKPLCGAFTSHHRPWPSSRNRRSR